MPWHHEVKNLQIGIDLAVDPSASAIRILWLPGLPGSKSSPCRSVDAFSPWEKEVGQDRTTGPTD